MQVNYPYGPDAGNPYFNPTFGGMFATFTATGQAVPDVRSTAVLFAMVGAGRLVVNRRRSVPCHQALL